MKKIKKIGSKIGFMCKGKYSPHRVLKFAIKLYQVVGEELPLECLEIDSIFVKSPENRQRTSFDFV